MLKKKIVFIGLISSLVVGNVAAAKSYSTEKEILHNKEFTGMYTTARGEVRMIKEDPNDEPTVFKWTGKKYKEVKDPYSNFVWNVNKKKTTGYTMPTASSNQKVYYAGKEQIVYKYNKKGKIKAKFNLKKQLKGYTISKVTWANKDNVVVQARKVHAKNKILFINVTGKKVIANYQTKFTSLLAVKDKIGYIISGEANMETETISKVVLKSGKVKESIQTKSLRDTASDITTEDDDYGLLRDQGLVGAISKNDLIVKYCNGLYKLSFSTKSFVKVSKGDFNAGNLYISALEIDKLGAAYVLGYKSDNEYPNGLYLYQ